jgi:FKBP-type peptidyl-prolyl cis-trans isomerase SlyD
MNDKLTAAKDRVVHFHYVLRDSAGLEVESSRDGEPAAALIGHGSLMAGLEQSLENRSPGERFEVTLPPKDAFGERRDDWTQRVSKKYVSGASRLKSGMQTKVQTDSGPRPVTVLKVGGKFIDVDLNHPLAGQSVVFDVEVIDVREATPEELSHGHVHGAGGHQH